jgi:hypothetical protein
MGWLFCSHSLASASFFLSPQPEQVSALQSVKKHIRSWKLSPNISNRNRYLDFSTIFSFPDMLQPDRRRKWLLKDLWRLVKFSMLQSRTLIQRVFMRILRSSGEALFFRFEHLIMEQDDGRWFQ